MATHWSHLTLDPGDNAVQSLRRSRLEVARLDPVDSRIEWIASQCRGRNVLDVGCVGFATDGPPVAELHRAIAAAAGKCLGVDTNQAGIAALQGQGFDVVFADITSPEIGDAVGGPFEVIVGGELIEHLLNVGALLTNATALLEPQGSLILTSPNPYAITWVPKYILGRYSGDLDHIASFDPYQMAEIADRTGFELTAWMGERACSEGKRAILEWLARTARRFRPSLHADCEVIIYVLTKP